MLGSAHITLFGTVTDTVRTITTGVDSKMVVFTLKVRGQYFRIQMGGRIAERAGYLKSRLLPGTEVRVDGTPMLNGKELKVVVRQNGFEVLKQPQRGTLFI